MEVRREHILSDCLRNVASDDFHPTKCIKVQWLELSTSLCTYLCWYCYWVVNACMWGLIDIVLSQAVFIGEEGEDGGGPRRELWHLFGKRAKNSSSVNVTITHWSVMKITPSCTQNGQEYCTLKSVWYHRLSLGWEILQVPIRTICYRSAGAFIGRNDHRYFWSRTPTET